MLADAEFTAKRLELEKLVKAQGDVVCNMKAAADTKPEALQVEVAKLRDLKEEQKKLVLATRRCERGCLCACAWTLVARVCVDVGSAVLRARSVTSISRNELQMKRNATAVDCYARATDQ